jgi:GAF domain-containing protein
MIETSRESRLNAAFAALAETLTSEYDVVELLHTLMGECIGLLDVQAGGLLLANPHGELELVASTSEAASFVEVMQLNAGAGPCIDCFHTGEPVSVADVRDARPDWAPFTEAALQEGYHSTYGVPLRVRSQIIGAMGLFRSEAGELAPADAATAQALANVAAIGILQERVLRESAIVAEQLQRALDSRVLIEQAKGVLAALNDLDMDEAFQMLRDHARRNNLNLHSVAQGVIERTVHIGRASRRITPEPPK